uniref:Uncharacterized protein n=1 Tax=Oryza sativa subsp. japonica TaxID=39947 RepID=Q2QZZ0_ORYSJ|nr:hypothetical protein LOC_Os11g44360 [Oryza sativa Japonica Group]
MSSVMGWDCPNATATLPFAAPPAHDMGSSCAVGTAPQAIMAPLVCPRNGTAVLAAIAVAAVLLRALRHQPHTDSPARPVAYRCLSPLSHRLSTILRIHGRGVEEGTPLDFSHFGPFEKLISQIDP